jgi:twitching motility protein PilT
MIDHLNSNFDLHILTIEDPIEFVHASKRGVMNQRELGSNTKSFSAALRSALREDPDVILVGEMRDLETISLALTAAETGHLVFGTLHTQSAPKTCDRIIDVFPPDQQKLVRMMFAESFQAIICQTLLPKKTGDGRVCAMEIMIGNPATRSLIREGKTHQLPTIIQTSAKLGMQSLDQNLKDLLIRGVIDEATALVKANNPEFILRGGEEKLDQLGLRSGGGPSASDRGAAQAPDWRAQMQA